MAVTGCNFVRFGRSGLQAIRKYWPDDIGSQFELRRQALKLRFWDQRHTHGRGLLFDLSYERIKGARSDDIYELRVDDEVGGQANIRIVMFDPPAGWQPMPDHERPMRIVWVLEVMPKKRDDWTKNDFTRFHAARLVIKTRLYR